MRRLWPWVGRSAASALFIVAALAANATPKQVIWVPLAQFPLISAEQGYGTLGINRSVQGNPLVDGKTQVDGYGTHAPGRLVFAINGRCEWFKVRLNLDREVAYTKKGSVDFSIVGDGHKLFDSGILRATDSNLPVSVRVNVHGIKVLELVSGAGGPGNDSDHADWLEPQVTLAASSRNGGDIYYRVVQAKGISLRVSDSGQGIGLKVLGESSYRALNASTLLLGESTVGRSKIRRLDSGGVEFKRESVVDKRRCVVTETFEPSGDGIRWQVDIRSDGPAWSTPISTILKFDDPSMRRIWMPWNDPIDSHAGIGMGDDQTPWNDPLVAQPFRDRVLTYGENPNTILWTGDMATLPIISEMDAKGDRGVSLIQSPEDPLPAAQISTGKSGWFAFNRLNRRLGEGKPARFTIFLVPHAADPKAALACFVQRFPKFFEPPNPAVAEFGGCGAYSGDERILDAEAVTKLGKMDFKTMWKLSDDYAYMGMFIPPVTDPDERWQRIDDSESPPNYKPIWTSVRRLNDYAQMLKSNGFHLLSYFNVIEFGHDNKAVPAPSDPNARDLWKDPSQYLKVKAPNAPIRPNGTTPEEAWQGGWAMDPGDPGYLSHLLTQADRHLKWLPASEGVCIDRVDFMSQYNDLANDGVTFHHGGTARALVSSWINLMNLLGPKLHHAGKVIFANLMDPRLDIARHLDGVYAEFGNQPTVVNGLSFICLNKPLIAWTRNQDKLSDSFFQRHLYLGACPTAPYPTNNHCIQPSPEHDRWYLDYGPLFTAMEGRKWVLQPHALSVEGKAKANLFSVSGGYVVSVTFASGASSVILRLNRVPGLTSHARFAAILPGLSEPVPVAASMKNGIARVQVPVTRGCCVIRIRI